MDADLFNYLIEDEDPDLLGEKFLLGEDEVPDIPGEKFLLGDTFLVGEELDLNFLYSSLAFFLYRYSFVIILVKKLENYVL